jgi:hypothetical protein
VLINRIINPKFLNMKRSLFILLAGFLVIFSGILLTTSCTKEGPQGPSGVDASATCQQCHNFSDTITTKIFEYNGSQHASGDVVQRGASGTSCAACHTAQGFHEVLNTGLDTTAVPIPDGAPINCRTCHKIHVTYTRDDWGLTTTSPFHPIVDKTSTIDLTGDNSISNLCGRCHQARKVSPWLTDPKGTDLLTIASSNTRWGPHHGPQSQMLAGKAAFEMGNSLYNSSNYHRANLSCASCHMSNPQGKFVGGHTLHMASEETGDNVKYCKTTGCHPSATSFDVNGKQTEIKDMLEQLKVKLAVANVFDTNKMTLKAGAYSQIQLAVVWNFLMVEEDRSSGVHNYLYSHDMLQSGLDYMNSLGY